MLPQAVASLQATGVADRVQLPPLVSIHRFAVDALGATDAAQAAVAALIDADELTLPAAS